MAKYAFLYIDPEEYDPESPPPEAERVYQDIFKWFETNGEKFVSTGAELQHPRTATTIRKKSGKATVVDGPFIESKETIGGVSIVDVPDRAAAVALAKTWPGYAVEVRDVVESEGS